MRSAIARLHRRKDKEISLGHEEISFDTWHSGWKGDGTTPQLNGARYFSFEELQKYTDNFSQRNLIGQGGFGKVYRGYLPNGSVVAIKRADELSGYKYHVLKAFKNEIELLSRVHHKNIMSLVGFCFEQGEQMLVYEYISKGSLRDHLAGKFVTFLDWIKRLEIALDVARGLAYLHELANPQIIHRDVKSTSILLDENLNAKVSDFGISKLNNDKQERRVSSQANPKLARIETEVNGSFGYLDPEYIRTQQLSEKIDVYSFGVVMLELITAKSSIVHHEEGRITSLAEDVKTAIDESEQEYYGLRDVIDPKIVNQAKGNGLVKFVQLALACIQESASDRPYTH